MKHTMQFSVGDEVANVPHDEMDEFNAVAKQNNVTPEPIFSYRVSGKDMEPQEVEVPKSQYDEFAKVAADNGAKIEPLRRLVFANGTERQFTGPELRKFMSGEYRTSPDYQADRDETAAKVRAKIGDDPQYTDYLKAQDPKSLAESVEGLKESFKGAAYMARKTVLPYVRAFLTAPMRLMGQAMASGVPMTPSITGGGVTFNPPKESGEAFKEIANGIEGAVAPSKEDEAWASENGLSTVGKVEETAQGIGAFAAALHSMGPLAGNILMSATAGNDAYINRYDEQIQLGKSPEEASEAAARDGAIVTLGTAAMGAMPVSRVLKFGKAAPVIDATKGEIRNYGDLLRQAVDGNIKNWLINSGVATVEAAAISGGEAYLSKLSDFKAHGRELDGNAHLEALWDGAKEATETAGIVALMGGMQYGDYRRAIRDGVAREAKAASETTETRLMWGRIFPEGTEAVIRKRLAGENISRGDIHRAGYPEMSQAERNAIGDALVQDVAEFIRRNRQPRPAQIPEKSISGQPEAVKPVIEAKIDPEGPDFPSKTGAEAPAGAEKPVQPPEVAANLTQERAAGVNPTNDTPPAPSAPTPVPVRPTASVPAETPEAAPKNPVEGVSDVVAAQKHLTAEGDLKDGDIDAKPGQAITVGGTEFEVTSRDEASGTLTVTDADTGGVYEISENGEVKEVEHGSEQGGSPESAGARAQETPPATQVKGDGEAGTDGNQGRTDGGEETQKGGGTVVGGVTKTANSGKTPAERKKSTLAQIADHLTRADEADRDFEAKTSEASTRRRAAVDPIETERNAILAKISEIERKRDAEIKEKAGGEHYSEAGKAIHAKYEKKTAPLQKKSDALYDRMKEAEGTVEFPERGRVRIDMGEGTLADVENSREMLDGIRKGVSRTPTTLRTAKPEKVSKESAAKAISGVAAYDVDDSRRVLKRVNFEDGKVVATDGRILMAVDVPDAKATDNPKDADPYPDWNRVVPKEKYGDSVVFNIEDAWKKATRARMLNHGDTWEGSMSVAFAVPGGKGEPGRLEFLRFDDKGRVTFSTTDDIRGGKFVAPLDAELFTKLLKAGAGVGERSFKLSFDAANKPIRLDGERSMALQMPLRTSGFGFKTDAKSVQAALDKFLGKEVAKDKAAKADKFNAPAFEIGSDGKKKPIAAKPTEAAAPVEDAAYKKWLHGLKDTPKRRAEYEKSHGEKKPVKRQSSKSKAPVEAMKRLGVKAYGPISDLKAELARVSGLSDERSLKHADDLRAAIAYREKVKDAKPKEGKKFAGSTEDDFVSGIIASASRKGETGDRHMVATKDERLIAKSLDEKNGTNLDALFNVSDAIAKKDIGFILDHVHDHFTIAKTNPELKKYGLNGDTFTIGTHAIKIHDGKDANHIITPSEWISIANSLDDPLVIAKYGTDDGSYRLWTEAKINGNYTLVGVTVKSPGRDLLVNSIKTVFGDERIDIKQDDIIYNRGNGEGLRTLLRGPNSREYSETPQTAGSIAKSAEEVKAAPPTQRPRRFKRLNEDEWGTNAHITLGKRRNDISFGDEDGYIEDFGEVKRAFQHLNRDATSQKLAERVFDICDRIGMDALALSEKVDLYGWNAGNIVALNPNFFNDPKNDPQKKAETILHECLHAVTSYALDIVEGRNPDLKDIKLTKELTDAVHDLEVLFDQVHFELEGDKKTRYSVDYELDDELKKQLSDDPEKLERATKFARMKELIAELANPDVRKKLKATKVWTRIVDAIRRIFNFFTDFERNPSRKGTETDRKISALKVSNDILDRFLSNANPELIRDVSDVNLHKARSQFASRKGAAPAKPVFDDPQSKAKNLREQYQDSRIKVRDFEEKVGITDKAKSAYHAADRKNGLIEHQFDKLERDFVAPILRSLAEQGIDPATFDRYLVAEHAAERNAVVASRGGGQGASMTDAEAQQFLDDLRARGEYDRYHAIGEKVWAMNQEGLDRALSSGRISQQYHDQLTKQYPHYVPLRFDMENEELDTFNRSIGGWRKNEYATAEGHTEEEDSPLAFSFMQAEQSIKAANENIVRQKVAENFETAAKRGFDAGKIYKGRQMKKTWAFDVGKDVITADEGFNERDRDDLIFFKRDGDLYAVVVNPGKHGGGLDYARAITGKNMPQLGAFWRGIRSFTQWKARMRTSLVPTFIGRNFKNDTFETQRHLDMDFGVVEGKKIMASVAKWEVKNAPAVMAYAKDGKLTGGYVQEYVENGGLIGGGVASNYADQARRIRKDIGYYAKHGLAVSAFRAAMKGIQVLNELAENSTRIGVYSALRERGMSVEDAISWARDNTGNFNRKGTKSDYTNSLWMFSNAAVQGHARDLHGYKNAAEHGAGRLASNLLQTAMVGTTLALLAHYFGNDEEREKAGASNARNETEYAKQTQMSVPVGGGKKAQWGMRGLAASEIYAARKIAEVVLGDTDARDAAVELAKYAGDQLTSVVGGNGLDSPSKAAQTVSPAHTDMLVQMALGKDYKDDDLYRRKFNEYDPDSWNGSRKTPEIYAKVAQALNAVTGGNEHRKGNVDLAPETIKLFAEELGGGVMRDIDTAYQAVKGAVDTAKGDAPDDLVGSIPFVRDTVRKYPSVSGRFWEAYDRYKADKNDHDGADPKRQAELEKEHPYLKAPWEKRGKKYVRGSKTAVDRLFEKHQDLQKQLDGNKQGWVIRNGKYVKGDWKPHEWSPEEKSRIRADMKSVEAQILKLLGD